MRRWRQTVIGGLRSGYPLEKQDTLSDSSDDESITPLYDDICSDEGSSSKSEPEPVLGSPGAPTSVSVSGSQRKAPSSLLKLVKAETPSIEKAKHLLSDRTPDDIREAINQKDALGNSVIHYACAKALVPWVELLIVNRADINVKGEYGQTPLHFTVKGEAKNASQQEPKSGTPLLHITCQNDQFENAMLLLEHGADPLKEDRARGDTPLHIILRKGQVKYALRFLKKCKEMKKNMQEILLARNSYQQCVLHEAVKCGDIDLVKYCMEHVAQPDDHDHLLKIKSKGESTLMHIACRHGHPDIVKMLDKICPTLLECPNKKKLTPLHSACSRDQAKVTNIVCDLLKERRDGEIHNGMEESDPEGPPSILQYTAKKGAIDCLVVLLKRQVQSTLFELLEWISVEKNLFKLLEALLNRSKEIQISKKQDEIKKLTRRCVEKGQTESFLVLVAWAKYIINEADYGNGDSLIHLIARNGHHQTTKAFLKNPDVQTRKKNEMGQTALHVAIQEGHRTTSALILKTDKGLAGIKDNKQMTPLMYACKTGNIYIVKLLLKMLKKAQMEIGFLDFDMNGLNCLDHAINNGHEMIAVELLDQDNWRSLMTHATSEGRTKTTPMRKLISSMPGVCKFVLDKCITTPGKDKDIQLNDVKIEVDFELLEDWYSEWMREAIPVPLGLESYVIPDSSLTASSECNADLGAERGRLNLAKTAWSSKVKDANQWIKVDLLVPCRITSVATQGRHDERQWVTHYKLDWSTDGTTFHTVQDISTNPGADRIFTGNVDCNTIVTNTLPVPQVCRYIRLIPVNWVGWISLRLEIYGEAIPIALGLESYVIPDSSLTASSECNANLGAKRGRLNLAKTAWSPELKDANKWFQVDLLVPCRITSVATQGRHDERQWVTRYKLAWSTDGKTFHKVQDISKNPEADMIFTGNVDCNTIVTNTLPVPQVCRYIRLIPVSWLGRVSLRTEIYGEAILNDPVPVGLESKVIPDSSLTAILNDPVPVGLESKVIPDSSLTASSERNANLGAKRGRLNLTKTAWSPEIKDDNQWIQVDLLVPCRITSVATQGRHDKRQWVTRYKLAWSTDGTTFHTVQDISTNPKSDVIFTGNADHNTIKTNTLPVPQVCRFVRLIPVRWVGQVSLRMEIYREGDDQPNEQRNIYKDKLVSSNFNNDGTLKCNARLHVSDLLYRSDNHPVQLMINNDESKELLNHPVVRLMFYNKHDVFRLEYWLRLSLQLLLLVFLTLHSLIIPPPYYVQKHMSGGNYTWLADGEAKWKEDLDPIALVVFGLIGTWLILVLTVIYFFEFLYRKWLYRKTKSNSVHLWLSVIRELTLLILIILFVVPVFGDIYYGYGVTFKADWQWELGAYAVLLAWINFMFFLESASFFGIYILMFLEVISTMVSFLLVAGIFICTFAVVFCILIINQTQYHTFGDSLAKSLTMLTGGIDFDAVFHPMDYLYQPSTPKDFTSVVFYPNTTHVIFIIFLFSMPIVVMNLLTGLAVYDIDVIQKKAKTFKQTIEAEGIMAMQNNMYLWVWKKSVFQHKTEIVIKNVSSLKAICYKLIGYKDTHEYLVAFLEKLKTDERVVYKKTTDMKIDDVMNRIYEVRNLQSDDALDAP